jgi:alpha-tubulin suppressor-like RCC1 family protein
MGGSGGSGGACKDDPDCQSTDFCADGTCHHRVAQIACGAATTCVLVNDGSIRCAGLNGSGELGNGTITTTGSFGISTAVKVVGLPSNDAPQQVAPGGSHTCALLTSGAVYCWGGGGSGQMGNGSFTGSTSPVKVPLPAAASKVASGDSFICAVVNDGSVWCWGDNFFGELGDGTFTNGRTDQGKPSPVQVATKLFTSPDALVASTRTAHVMVGAQIFSWGEDKFGELGTGSPTTSSPFGSATPVSTSYAGQAVAISAASSGSHACLITNQAIIRCWGDNAFGQLGDGTVNSGVATSTYATPNTVTGLTGTPSAVIAGGSHTCAIMTNGDFDCWGDDFSGELGDGVLRNTGSDQSVPSPSKATVVPGAPVAAALGVSHTCVLLKNGSVWCWGANGNGQLGNGAFIDSPTAVRMTGW